MVKEGTYIHIESWMINEYKLSGNSLFVYAIIYGFSQDKKSDFHGGLQFLADWTNSTKQGVIKNLKSLLEKKLIIKIDERNEKGVFCRYIASRVLENRPVAKSRPVEQSFDDSDSIKFNKPIQQNLMGDSTKFNEPIKQSLHNTIYNTIYNTKFNTLSNTENKKIESEESKDLNLQNLQKELYELITDYNKSSPLPKTIPVSNSFFAFLQKESREFLEYHKCEKPTEILQTLKNYLQVAKSDTWKKVFSWREFIKNYLDYSPEFFCLEKYLIQKPKEIQSVESQNMTEILENAKRKKEEEERKAELQNKFDDLNPVRQKYARKIFDLFSENNLPCERDFEDFKISFMSVENLFLSVPIDELYKDLLVKIDKMKKREMQPLSFDSLIKKCYTNKEVLSA